MKKPINKKTIFIFGGVVLIVLTILSLIIFNGFKSKKHYEQALAMFQKKEYVQAVEVFDSLKTYKDSVLYSEKCRIAIGDSLLEQEEFEKAEEEYKKIENLTLQSEMLNKCNYTKAIKLFNEKNFWESRNIFEKLGSFKESKDYLSKCCQEIKFLKFDYTGTDDAYTDFYEYYGKTDAATDINSAENYLSFLYGTWFDRNDSKIEISPTHFNGKEYGVCAVANRAALIYFFEDENSLYELYGGHDYIAGDSLEYSVANNRDNATIYISMTKAEYEKAYKEWEEEQAKIPSYADSDIINRTSARAKDRLSSGYSGTERLYHSFNVDSSSVSYDWTTRTYTCYLSVTYSTNVFDFWGTSKNSYSVTATFKDTGSELVATGFSMY